MKRSEAGTVSFAFVYDLYLLGGEVIFMLLYYSYIIASLDVDIIGIDMEALLVDGLQSTQRHQSVTIIVE